MPNFTLSRLAVGASVIAMATAFAVPAQAQVTGTQDAQPATTNTPATSQQTTPV